MLSSILRLRSFSSLTTCIFKTELCSAALCSKNQRQLFTEKILSSNKYDIDRFNDVNVHELVNSGKNSENFGKIVSLDPDEIETPYGEYPNERSNKKKKRTKKGKDKASKKDEASVIAESDNVVEDETGVEEKEKSGGDKKIKKSHIGLHLKSIGSVMSNLKSKNQREKYKKVILEGKRLINEAITAGFEPSVLYFSRNCDIEKFKLSSNVTLCKLPYKTLKLWSDVMTPQGVIGVFEMPKLEARNVNPNSLPLTVICDNIREPGNMGCIIRLLAAVGCKKLLITKGCVDIWEPKVLRAAAGAHFRLPVLSNVEWKDLEDTVSETSKVFMADCGSTISGEEEENVNKNPERGLFKTHHEVGDNMPLKCYDVVNYKSEDTVIVIGGETLGLSKEAYEFAEKRQGVRVYIPMSNNIESLNNSVALGVLSYEVRRQMKIESQDETSTEEENQTNVGFHPEPIIPGFA